MPLIIAVGSPKGGVGKSTEAYHLAWFLAVMLGLKVLLVDADDNHSSADWCDDAISRGREVPFDHTIAAGSDAAHLAGVRNATDYDVVIIDLPGSKEGAWRTMIEGPDGKPIPDLMIIMTKPRLMDLRPVIRAIDAEITPLKLGYLVVLTMARPDSIHLAEARRDELRDDLLINVCDVIVREYAAYDLSHERGLTVYEYGGPANERARKAEADQRALALDIQRRLRLARRTTR
ncbi:MAG: ParA family protein [Pseudonocardiaceae bacterium]